MRVAISGASGLMGTALSAHMNKEGLQVLTLTRGDTASSEDQVAWQPAKGYIDAAPLENTRVVVHLAGENIADGRWNKAKKQRIRDSRIQGTALLSKTLATLHTKPQTLICASATGYYGDRADELLDESSAPGNGFLAEVCRDWEHAAAPAVAAGIRVVHLRTGVVLSERGGALTKLLPLFRLGLGGPIGTGRAWMSWITLADQVAAIMHCINDKRITGPVNAVSPRPVTNRDFTRALGKALGRPAILPAPKAALVLALGEMARETILASTRVLPRQLEDAGFTWRHPEITEALDSMLNRKQP